MNAWIVVRGRSKNPRKTEISVFHVKTSQTHCIDVWTKYADEAEAAIRALMQKCPPHVFSFADKLETIQIGYGY